MIPTPAANIQKIDIRCQVKNIAGQYEARVYNIQRAKLKNGYHGLYSQGSIYYTNENQGPMGEPITCTIEWVLPYITEFENWGSVLEFLRAMRAKDISYTME